jgi:hypothetical protein
MSVVPSSSTKLLNDCFKVSITQLSQSHESLWVFDHPLANDFWQLLGKQQQLFFVGIKFHCELVDQLLRRAMPFFEFVVLDLRDVGEADADVRCEFSERKLLCLTEFPYSFAKGHTGSPACFMDPEIVHWLHSEVNTMATSEAAANAEPQIDLLTETLEPMIQRELVHRGFLAENRGYDARLVGRVEVM